MKFASAAAYSASVLKKYDEEHSTSLRDAAKLAWKWGLANKNESQIGDATFQNRYTFALRDAENEAAVALMNLLFEDEDVTEYQTSFNETSTCPSGSIISDDHSQVWSSW